MRSARGPHLALLSVLVAAGCSAEPDTAGPDVLADDYDECAELGWYGDGECDVSCLEADPDCADAECQDACADVCDAEWAGAATPVLPAGCSAEMCACGEAPVECPDVCEAECLGQPAPVVPADCPVYACDCYEVIPNELDDEEGGSLRVAETGDRCGSRASGGGEVDAADADDSARAVTSSTRKKRTISVVFHVVRAPIRGGSGGVGDAPRARLVRQINVMNAAYRRTPFKFKLARIHRVTNRSWFGMKKDSAVETQAKRNLHSGTAATLNVYTTGTPSALGWATFPWDRKGKQDGIVMKHTTLPGGAEDKYNLGDTLVHEAGHWLGLYHTFQGGCAGGGDGIGDTPAEGEPAFDCPVGRDTCSSKAGNDPVKNFMDYTDDSCMDRFSAGQRRRLGRMTNRYRPASNDRIPEPGCGDGTCTGDETDTSCPADCGCAAAECSGVAPFGCYCDPECAANGDCCADADTCS